jgi:uncharacterized protein (DUF1684 family)
MLPPCQRRRNKGDGLLKAVVILNVLLVSVLFFPPLSGAGSSPLSLKEPSNPMDKREEKVKEFREKRDQFFKEDPRSPLKDSDLRNFKSLAYFPFNLKYAQVGTIERAPAGAAPSYVNLRTNKGTEKRYVKFGRFTFRLDGIAYVLQVYRVLGGDELFLPFRDKTAGRETYSKGRYLFIEPMPQGKVLVDFNRAYNPFCAYDEKYTCPDPPPENWLNTEIRAGEKRFR